MPSNTPRLDNQESNLILNGDFSLWQRGVTANVITGSRVYLADRFSVQNALPSQTIVYSQSSDTPTVAQSGYQSPYSLMVANSATPSTIGASNFIHIKYRMEGLDYSRIHAKKVRIQFWAKSSVSGTYGFVIANTNDTRTYVTTFTINASATWQKVVLDVQLDTVTANWVFDNTHAFQINFILSCGSSFQTSNVNQWQSAEFFSTAAQTQWATTSSATFQIDQVMIIPQDFTLGGAANVDVPFQRAGRTIQQELAMCQRYYTKSFPLLTAPQNGSGSGIWTGLFAGTYISSCTRAGPTNGFDGFNQIVGREVTFPVSMRTAPTLVAYGTNASNWFAYDTNGVVFGAAIMSGACDRSFTPTLGALIGTTTAQAQMGGHYTADAEL